MADQAIGELIQAQSIGPTDLFVLEQSNVAKSLKGQVLLNWLTAAADGHGGIQSIVKQGTSGLVDTYRITLADTTTFDFVVTNGKSITGISKQSTSGLKDTYKITYNDGTYTTFVVTNGAKGDKGNNAYVWIKYASQEPTAASHSMSDLPDKWMGIYSGNSPTAPADWTQYKWYEIKGAKGDTGAPATLVSRQVAYQVSTSGTVPPSGTWSETVPSVAQGRYLWTRVTATFNTGEPVVSYSVSRMGMDGLGSVVTVNGNGPDENGNVQLTAVDVGGLALSGGSMTGAIDMDGHTISGLNPPTEATQVANKGYVDAAVRKAAPRNLLDNSDFTNLVAQAGIGGNHGTTPYAADRWILDSGTVSYTTGIGLTLTGTIRQKLENAPATAYPYIGMASGTATIRYANGAVTITSSGGVIKWAALYEGEYTAETLPEYQPKGYGAELAACLHYFERIGDAKSAVLGVPMFAPSGASSFLCSVAYYPKRLQNPTVLLNGVSNYRALVFSANTVEGYGAMAVSSFDTIYTTSTRCQFRVNFNGTFVIDSIIILQRTDDATKAYIDISAEF